MRRSHYLLPMILLAACIDRPAEVTPPPVVETPVDTASMLPSSEDPGVLLVPLSGTGLRFDGAYRVSRGDLRYYMRFFERGNAAFVGGTEKYEGQLAAMLTIDVQSGWNQVHNCPVQQRNDSLFIRSVGLKGVITYAGEVRANGDSMIFLRHSEINGSNQLMPYVFVPDSALVPKP